MTRTSSIAYVRRRSRTGLHHHHFDHKRDNPQIRRLSSFLCSHLRVLHDPLAGCIPEACEGKPKLQHILPKRLA